MTGQSFPMTLENFPDYDDPSRIGAQTLSWNYDNFKGEFNVQNLNSCPEDAIIGRDLFDAIDFIKAINFGMQLGHLGYEFIEFTEKNN